MANPGIGVPAAMFEGFALIASLFMVRARYDGGVTVDLDLEVVRFEDFKV